MITLHKIFSELIDDPYFLTTIINNTENEIKQLHSCNMMTNMVSDYVPLIQFDIQKYNIFSSEFKKILPSSYTRIGIKNFIEKNYVNINISFLNSINILLRPTIFKLPINDQIKNYELFESFIIHKISRNCKIDKIKNTKKIQNSNKEIIRNILGGRMTIDIIKSIIDIFEINLLVFDFTKNEIYFHWSSGYLYPHLNLFNKLYCVSHIQGIYEPLMSLDTIIPDTMLQYIYIKILVDPIIQHITPIKMSVPSLLILDDWNVSVTDYVTIINKYFI